MNLREIGDQLRCARLAAGLTMRELAAKAGLSHQLVDKAESGGSIRFSSLEKLSEAASARLVVRIEPGIPVGPINSPATPPDRLAVAARFLAVLPRLSDRDVDVLLHEIALWEAKHAPQGEQR